MACVVKMCMRYKKNQLNSIMHFRPRPSWLISCFLVKPLAKNISYIDNESQHPLLLKLYCSSVTLKYTEWSTSMQYGLANLLRLSVENSWGFAYVIAARFFGPLFFIALFIEFVTCVPRLSEVIYSQHPQRRDYRLLTLVCCFCQ